MMNRHIAKLLRRAANWLDGGFEAQFRGVIFAVPPDGMIFRNCAKFEMNDCTVFKVHVREIAGVKLAIADHLLAAREAEAMDAWNAEEGEYKGEEPELK